MRFSPCSLLSLKPAGLLTLLLVLSIYLAGCDRGSAPSTARATDPGQAPAPARPNAVQGNAPTRDDVVAFLRSVPDPSLRMIDVQTDAPIPDPELPGAWVVNAKLVLTPKEDLFRPADEDERRELNSLTERFNKVVDWRNGYAKTPYGRSGIFADLPTPTPKVRPLLVATIKAGAPLPAIYAKLRAARQVDRWRWEPLDGDVAATAAATHGGVRRADYEADAVVLGTPEATAYLDGVKQAVTAAEAWKAGIEKGYAARLREGTRPGMIYRGQITYGHLGTVPVEIRFGERPLPQPGKPGTAACEVIVTSAPTYRVTYQGWLALDTPTDASVTSNVVLSCTRAEGKDYAASKLPPEVLMVHQLGSAGRGQQYFLSLAPDGTLSGGIAPGYYGGFQLTALLVK